MQGIRVASVAASVTGHAGSQLTDPHPKDRSGLHYSSRRPKISRTVRGLALRRMRECGPLRQRFRGARAASAKCNRISVTVLAKRAPVAQLDPALDLLARGGDSTADKKFTILCLSCSPSASISSCVRRSGPMGLMNKAHSCLICRARLASTELPV